MSRPLSPRSGPKRLAPIFVALALALPLGMTGAAPTFEPEPARGVTYPVASDDTTYALCGRVFSDPHAYWPLESQADLRSPFAKGNAPCAATDFLTYEQMVSGVGYLESLFPDFIEFYNLEEDFGDGADCATSTDSFDLCSAGLPRQGTSPERVRSDLYMIRVTDERVPDDDKRFFNFPLGIHGIERAGVEAGVRATEDLAAWAYCEGLASGQIADNGRTNCALEGAIPHPLLETSPGDSVTAGQALAQSAIYFIFPNPDGWRRGDPDNLARFYQRYNGNGVDLNRDWPTVGYTFRPYTPWSEPETRGFGEVLKSIRDTWDGGIDLHGQLIDRAFSFTLLGASQRDFAKNQRILQTVKGAWADAEARFAWAPHIIKPNDAPDQCTSTGDLENCDQRMWGVQWGTVWDTIDYTVTGSLGDWIDSPIGLGADGIDNEMSFSHLSNCGTGTCYEPDFEQLHIDGNKSLVYSMVNFTLLPEDNTFAAPGKVGYVFDDTVRVSSGSGTPPPTEGLAPQDDLQAVLDATNDWSFAFEVKGPDDGFYNGGLEGIATPVNVGGVSADSLTSLVLEQFRPDEETPQEDAGCGAADDHWGEVNRYFNQSSIYLQSGQAVHANSPLPGIYRICITGGLVTKMATSGGHVELDVRFSTEQAWADPGQLPYSVTNMEFFADLAPYAGPGELVRVDVDDVLNGSTSLDQFTSLVVADDPLPGYTEPVGSGEAQPGQLHEPPTLAAATAPCAYPTQPVLPPTCVADYPFTVDNTFNNQQLVVTLTSPEGVENDWDLYVERRSVITGEWFPVGQSTTPTGNEQVTLLTPPGGEYRTRIVNWAGTIPPDRLEIAFSNEYAGPPLDPSTRTDEARDAWGAALRAFVERGGNLVLTDGAIRDLAWMGLIPREKINAFSVYAGYIGFTADGESDTYDDALAANVNQPGAAEGPGHRHQTYEPVPIGFAIQNADGADFNGSPVWSVDQVAWEEAGGRTVGLTTPDQVTLGELAAGDGVVRIIGPLLPMPSQQYYHPFGLANYALTYTGYQVLQNALEWERSFADLEVSDIEASRSTPRASEPVTITATVANGGEADAGATLTRFVLDDETVLGEVETPPIAAGESATVEVTWDTRGQNGEHEITVTADAGDAVVESSEANNSATLTVTVRGNRIENGSFEQASDDGSGPAAWEGESTDAGEASWSEGGSHGERSVSLTGTGGSVAVSGSPTWTSAPVAVTAGEQLTLALSVSADGASSAGAVRLELIGAAGELLGMLDLLELPLSTGGFALLEETLTVPEGVSEVRVVLSGFAATDLATAGTIVFDDVGLYGE